MTFPLPKDVRAARSFELVKGTDEVLRTPMVINNKLLPIAIGEWVKLGAVNDAVKIVVGDNLANPANGARVSWTNYVPADPYTGQGDALATGTIDVLTGKFMAWTTKYNAGGVLTPGALLVVDYDGVSAGQLDGVTVGAATTKHLEAAVGRIIEVTGGRLLFESL